jgi:hypothetical protein
MKQAQCSAFKCDVWYVNFYIKSSNYHGRHYPAYVMGSTRLSRLYVSLQDMANGPYSTPVAERKPLHWSKAKLARLIISTVGHQECSSLVRLRGCVPPDERSCRLTNFFLHGTHAQPQPVRSTSTQILTLIDAAGQGMCFFGFHQQAILHGSYPN